MSPKSNLKSKYFSSFYIYKYLLDKNGYWQEFFSIQTLQMSISTGNIPAMIAG